MKIVRGDLVVVIAGNAKSPTPHKVTAIQEDGRKVVVEGVNTVLRHVKRGHPKSPQGGRLSKELPIDISNVMLYCEACGSPTRVGYRYADDGSKERFCKKCQARISKVSPPNPKRAKA
jgi:large subunit ribosomal protein L24